MENLLRYKFDQRYLVFDTETEGLNLVKSRSWQLSWLVATGRKIESIHDHFLDWPNLQVGAGAARVTGFTMSNYNARKEDARHVFSLFLNELRKPNTIAVAHNLLRFDVYMLKAIARELDMDFDFDWIHKCLDTNALSVAVKKKWQPQPNAKRIEWQYKLASHIERGLRTNMAAMLKHYDIEFDKDKLHDGKYDMTKNFELLHKILGDIDL
jgi:DNA polymerase III epsilon subunit-like protein